MKGSASVKKTQAQRDRYNKYLREWRAKKVKKRTSVGRPTHAENRKAKIAAIARIMVENPATSVGAAARQAGLSEHTINNPRVLTQSPEWAELMEQYLPQAELLDTHKGLLKASRIDHMSFIAEQNDFTDEDIKSMFSDLNCTVRKIIHRETGARDVYFWSPDNKARASALDLAYKLRGSYAVDKASVMFSLASLARLRAPELPAGGPIPPEQQLTAENGTSLPRAAV